jgi:glycosyltransferase involved in cell wall biosynthesis
VRTHGGAALPEITIGMPFRDPGAYFDAALRSIFAQTYENWELLLVDDGCSDGSSEVAKNLRDDRIRVIGDGISKGLIPRLNEAISCARGKYFLRMDADDIMHPDRLARQLAVLRSADDDTLVGSAVYSIDGNSRVRGIRGYPCPGYRGYGARHALIHPTIGAATSWFAKHRYDGEFVRAEDAELYCRTSHSTRFLVIPEALVYYREIDVFDLRKRLDTAAGLQKLLLKHFRAERSTYLYHASVELLKLWLYILANSFGRPDLIIRRCCRELSAEESLRANRGLDAVLRQRLPSAAIPERRGGIPGYAAKSVHEEMVGEFSATPSAEL